MYVVTAYLVFWHFYKTLQKVLEQRRLKINQKPAHFATQPNGND